MKELLSHQVLKELVFKFRETRYQSIFCKILTRIDGLIVYVIYKFVAKRPQFRNANFQELYNSAILGLYRGIDTAKEGESGALLQARLIAYMKSEMSNFCNRDNEKSNITSLYDLGNTSISEETVYHNLEMEFLRERYQRFIDDGIIDSTDWKLLNMRFVDGMKIKDIAEVMQCHKDTVRRKIKNSLNRIRWELRRRKLEDI